MQQQRWWQEDHQAIEFAGRLRCDLQLSTPVEMDRILQHFAIQTKSITAPPSFRGMLIADESVIEINAALPDWPQRYVLAHEVGHAAIRQGILQVRPHRHERICQVFAANLLMPPGEAKWIASNYLGRADMLDRVMTHFHVSREAACIQLRRLGILPDRDATDMVTAEQYAADATQFDALIQQDLQQHDDTPVARVEPPAAPPGQTYVRLYTVDVDAIYRKLGMMPKSRR